MNIETISSVIRLSALIISVCFYLHFTKRSNLSKFERLYFLLITILLGYLGSISFAKIEFISSVTNITLQNLYQLSYGGRISGAILLPLLAYTFLKKDKIDTLIYPITLTAIVGIWMIGKWSCFIIQDECFGTHTKLPWGMVLDNSSLFNLARHPIPAYDSFFGMILLVMNRAIKKSDSFFRTFQLIIALSVYGFMIEFIRVNPNILLSFSINQIGYAVIILICLALILKRQYQIPTSSFQW